jgi:hypothetical protein
MGLFKNRPNPAAAEFTKDRADAVLFSGMTRDEMHNLAVDLGGAAKQLHRKGHDAAALETFQVCADLHAAWRRNFAVRIDEQRGDR